MPVQHECAVETFSRESHVTLNHLTLSHGRSPHLAPSGPLDGEQGSFGGSFRYLACYFSIITNNLVSCLRQPAPHLISLSHSLPRYTKKSTATLPLSSYHDMSSITTTLLHSPSTAPFSAPAASLQQTCHKCGAELSHSHSAIAEDAQARISELETQVRILTGKATAAGVYSIRFPMH